MAKDISSPDGVRFTPGDANSPVSLRTNTVSAPNRGILEGSKKSSHLSPSYSRHFRYKARTAPAS